MNFSKKEMMNLMEDMKIKQVFSEEDMKLFGKQGYSFSSDSKSDYYQ